MTTPPKPKRQRVSKRKRPSSKSKGNKEDEIFSVPAIAPLSPTETERVARVWRARRTLRAMLTTRGYANVNTVFPEFTFNDYQEQFLQRFQHEQLTHFTLEGTTENENVKSRGIAEKLFQDAPHHRLVVFFLMSDTTLGVDHVRPVLAYVKKHKFYRALVVIEHALTPKAKDIFLQHRRQNVFVDVFTLKELAIDKTKHVLQPHFELLTLEDRSRLFQSHKLDPAKLMCIFFDDPIARHFGALPGDVFKVSRSSETGGLYISYRRVIHKPSKSKFQTPLG